MTKSRKLKSILLLAAIIVSIKLIKYYSAVAGMPALNAALKNPITSLTIAVPNSAVGAMIYYLGKMLVDWKANLSKGVKILGAYYFFGGIVIEIVSIVYFIIHLF